MKGAIYQLHAEGEQDIYLNTKDISTSYYKTVFKKSTSFAIEPMKLQFNEVVNFGNKITIDIPKAADLLGNIYFYFKLPPLVKTDGVYAAWTNSIGHAIINYADFIIGGKVVDKRYGLFMNIWNELTTPLSLNNGNDLLTGKINSIYTVEVNAEESSEYYVPLPFWFTHNPALFFPLIALRHQKISLCIQLRPFSECIVYDGATPPNTVAITDAFLLAEYVYLHDFEREHILNKKNITYVISQLQRLTPIDINSSDKLKKVTLDFNHPCKELLWVFVETNSEANNDWFHYGQRVDNNEYVPAILDKAGISLDGHERVPMLPESYYRLVQPNMYHSFIPNKHIYVYSFSHNPEAKTPYASLSQPNGSYDYAGSINFSRIDNATLNLEFNNPPTSRLYVFSHNYNFLVIKNGMSGIAYLS